VLKCQAFSVNFAWYWFPLYVNVNALKEDLNKADAGKETKK
jgi:hypothetical protein